MLSENQIRLLEMYAKKSKVSLDQLVEWVEEGKTTISEISQGILGEKVN
jgi:hypothetical protein